jgi:hypothetical protein
MRRSPLRSIRLEKEGMRARRKRYSRSGRSYLKPLDAGCLSGLVIDFDDDC